MDVLSIDGLQLPECKSLRRIELALVTEDFPSWILTFLSAIDFGRLEELVLRVRKTQMFASSGSKDNLKALDELFSKKHQELGDQFPKVLMFAPISHPRICIWDVLLEVIKNCLPLTMSAGLCKVQY